jgi:hypothetical protein
LRLAVIGTPRSGNTWLRRLLATAYGLEDQRREELWEHDLTGVPWDDLPPRCVLQIHWRPVEPFTALLRDQGFRVVTPVRHPFDVLISILHYTWYVSNTGRWLDGEHGDESSIRGVSPRSEAFLSYATGPRAAALLSVSPEWGRVPDTLSVGYEDLVRDPFPTMFGLTQSLDEVDHHEVFRAIDACAIDRLRTPANAPHFWQGKPGLWRAFLTSEEAQQIARTHFPLFRQFGFLCDPDPSLTGDLADANWDLLARSTGDWSEQPADRKAG